MILSELKHAVLRWLHSSDETKTEKRLSDSAHLHTQALLLLDAIGLYGPVELESIYKNIELIRAEMLKRGISELKLNSEYTIKINVDRSINIIQRQ